MSIHVEQVSNNKPIVNNYNISTLIVNVMSKKVNSTMSSKWKY